jgi:hypothetical protein
VQAMVSPPRGLTIKIVGLSGRPVERPAFSVHGSCFTRVGNTGPRTDISSAGYGR